MVRRSCRSYVGGMGYNQNTIMIEFDYEGETVKLVQFLVENRWRLIQKFYIFIKFYQNSIVDISVGRVNYSARRVSEEVRTDLKYVIRPGPDQNREVQAASRTITKQFSPLLGILLAPSA